MAFCVNDLGIVHPVFKVGNIWGEAGVYLRLYIYDVVIIRYIKRYLTTRRQESAFVDAEFLATLDLQIVLARSTFNPRQTFYFDSIIPIVIFNLKVHLFFNLIAKKSK